MTKNTINKTVHSLFNKFKTARHLDLPAARQAALDVTTIINNINVNTVKIRCQFERSREQLKKLDSYSYNNNILNT